MPKVAVEGKQRVVVRSSVNGAYALVYKREKTLVLADLCFFDGDRNLEGVKEFHAMLGQVITEMEKMAR